MPFYPWLPPLALAALAGVIWSDWIDPDEGRPGLLIALAVALAFGGYYLVALRRRRWPAPEEA